MPRGSRKKRVLNKFTKEEDVRLTRLMIENPKYNWEEVAEIMKTKSARQLKDRWQNYLDPSLDRSPFSEEEDAIILELYPQIGKRWKLMASHLPNRSPVDVRNRCYLLLRKESKDGQKRQKKSSIYSNQGFDDPSGGPDDSDEGPAGSAIVLDSKPDNGDSCISMTKDSTDSFGEININWNADDFIDFPGII